MLILIIEKKTYFFHYFFLVPLGVLNMQSCVRDTVMAQMGVFIGPPAANATEWDPTFASGGGNRAAEGCAALPSNRCNRGF